MSVRLQGLVSKPIAFRSRSAALPFGQAQQQFAHEPEVAFFRFPQCVRIKQMFGSTARDTDREIFYLILVELTGSRAAIAGRQVYLNENDIRAEGVRDGSTACLMDRERTVVGVDVEIGIIFHSRNQRAAGPIVISFFKPPTRHLGCEGGFRRHVTKLVAVVRNGIQDIN